MQRLNKTVIVLTMADGVFTAGVVEYALGQPRPSITTPVVPVDDAAARGSAGTWRAGGGIDGAPGIRESYNEAIS